MVSRGTSVQQDIMCWGLQGDIRLVLNQEGAWTGSTCFHSLPAACNAMNGTKGGFLMAALPAGWSRMASIAISPSSIEKNQTCPLVPQKPSLSCAAARGTVALGLSSRATEASCSSSLPSRDEEGLSIFPQGVSNTSNLHALRKTCHISPFHLSSSGSDICKGKCSACASPPSCWHPPAD